jgi:hypothetical protein
MNVWSLMLSFPHKIVYARPNAAQVTTTPVPTDPPADPKTGKPCTLIPGATLGHFCSTFGPSVTH